MGDKAGNGVEVVAPANISVAQLLRRASASLLSPSSKLSTPKAECMLFLQWPEKKALRLDDAVPRELIHRGGRGGKLAGPRSAAGFLSGWAALPEKLCVLRVDGLFGEEEAKKAARSERPSHWTSQAAGLLQELNDRFADKNYQAALATVKSRREVLQLARQLQFDVLPRHGLEANDQGVWAMQVLTWLAMTVSEDVAADALRSMELSGVSRPLPQTVTREAPRNGYVAKPAACRA